MNKDITDRSECANVNRYSDITPEMCRTMKGEDIKLRGQSGNSHIDVVKNGKYDHTVHRPYDEIEDDKEYIVYECGRVAGSGICYTYMCIMIPLTDEECAMNAYYDSLDMEEEASISAKIEQLQIEEYLNNR